MATGSHPEAIPRLQTSRQSPWPPADAEQQGQQQLHVDGDAAGAELSRSMKCISLNREPGSAIGSYGEDQITV